MTGTGRSDSGVRRGRKMLLRYCARRVMEAKASLDSQVAEARADGLSWQDIGDALDVTRQAAWQKYERIDDPDLLKKPPQ